MNSNAHSSTTKMRRAFSVHTCMVAALTAGCLCLVACGRDNAAPSADATATVAIMTVQAALANAPGATPTPASTGSAADAPVAEPVEAPTAEQPTPDLTATAQQHLVETLAAATMTAIHEMTIASAIPTATATPLSAAPAGDVTGVVNADPLRVRAGPGTTFDIVTELAEGDTVRVFARIEDGSWLNIRTPNGLEGWVATEFVDLGAPLSTLLVIAAPPTPMATPTPVACGIAVANELRSYAPRADLGCPTGNARRTWAAFQPFEAGFLLWRKDTDEVYLFSHTDGWQSLYDRWPEGMDYPGRGDAPPGLQSPIRGFGYLWATDDSIYANLGWATDKEKGFCLLLQPFERGFALHSVGGRCGEGYNFADEPGFGLNGLRAMDNGYWQ